MADTFDDAKAVRGESIEVGRAIRMFAVSFGVEQSRAAIFVWNYIALVVFFDECGLPFMKARSSGVCSTEQLWR